MDDSTDVRSIEFLHKLDLTEAMVRDHVFLPDNVRDAALHLDLHDVGDGDGDPDEPPPPSGLFYRLNTDKLRLDLHNLLSGCVSGYSMQLRRYGQVVFDRQWNSAKTPPDGDLDWAADVQMHVASVSKLITAMAMTKLLYSRNISPDAHILPWLPGYWEKGPGIDQITFRKLLTHNSGLGFLFPNEAGPSDFEFMKQQIARGTFGNPGYRNINYGLCRILISTIDAPYLFNIFLPGVTDAYWDLTTIRYYQCYVSENIFDPVGVTSSFLHEADDALAYPYPANMPGRDSGDLSTMSGCAAWHLSVDDLLIVMAAFRRRNTIIDPVRAQQMLDRQFGLDVKKDTALGRIYAKGGFWSINKNFVEQSNVFFLPKGMELVVLANSPFCKPDTGFMDKVLTTIENSIENILVTTTVAAVGALALFALLQGARTVRRRP
jgi:CubicO group peptidase (beta-lactamase class C family)